MALAGFAMLAGCSIFAFTATVAAADDVRIQVNAEQEIGRISPYTTGACIEDVNHEIYGGIYSQMIFGESFQEPPIPVPPKGFAAYGGDWQVAKDELSAAAGDGPKLILKDSKISAGEVSVDILFPDKKPGNAGLILKVGQPGVGADRFIGYEVSLDTSGALVLGRHRNNWEPIRSVPCPVPIDQWINLAVRLTEKSLEVSVDGRNLLNYEDRDHPLAPGQIGLRTWQRTARFRELQVKPSPERAPKAASREIPRIAFEAEGGASLAGISGMWRPVVRGTAKGSFAIEPKQPFTGVQSQRLTFSAGAGELCLENKGLNRWGMSFALDKAYEGYVWVRSAARTPFYVALESDDGGQVLAEAKLEAQVGGWQRLDFTLTPAGASTGASDGARAAGRFAIKLKQPGSAVVGQALLQPGAWGRFKGLPVRKDIAEGLIAGGFTVLRYGGSMVNAEQYRWKQMIGPRDRRPPYRGTWYPYSSNGWAIPDFLNFCEAAGFLAVPDLNVNETPHDIADFIEYVNGPANSDWGARRVADGHPAPYGLKYIELGNEEAVNEAYWQKFRPLAEAIWATDPLVVPVVGDFAYGEHIVDPYQFKGAPAITSLAAHKKILDFAQEKNHPVWFDVHIWNDGPRDPQKQIEVLRELNHCLATISPGAEFKVCVFEENSGNHGICRALAHATAIDGIQRLGVQTPIVCCANCLQCDGQNDNGWDQGLLFLNPAKTWPQPPYFVTQMIAANRLSKCVRATIEGQGSALDVTARLATDGKTLAIQVVNMDDHERPALIHVDGFDTTKASGRILELSGEMGAVNTADHPDRIAPKEKSLTPEQTGQETAYVFPARSFTVIRWTQ